MIGIEDDTKCLDVTQAGPNGLSAWYSGKLASFSNTEQNQTPYTHLSAFRVFHQPGKT